MKHSKTKDLFLIVGSLMLFTLVGVASYAVATRGITFAYSNSNGLRLTQAKDRLQLKATNDTEQVKEPVTSKDPNDCKNVGCSSYF